MNEQSSQQQNFRILVVNPGSTSTKMAVFDDEAELVEQTIRHDADELASLGGFLDTQDLRQEGIVTALDDAKVAPESLDAVVGRGGLTKPIVSGTYEVSDAMVADLRSGEYGLHACNLGGIKAYLGTSDMREVEARVVAGDEQAALLFDACAYQVAKTIGAACAVLEGEVDAILLTGGLAYSERFCEAVAHRVRRLTDEVAVYPGEDELLALAQGGLRVLRGEEEAKIYA